MKIRNFCIIAHIDHGKSTLADRMLEITGTIQKRDIKAQTLDSMDLERERWITIKLTPVRMNWKWHELNLIDTPGHVDFQYEVSRSLASVEWAVLVVDATQWIEAQTLSNVYLAIEHDLTIIPVINKIDLPSADVEKVSAEIISLLGCRKDDIIPISAKTWMNVESVLDAVVEKITEPRKIDNDWHVSIDDTIVNPTWITKWLIFDSQYDIYKWVVIYLKLFSGSIKKGDKLELLNTKSKVEALEVGYFAPKYVASWVLNEWEIGYIVTWLKEVRDAQVWDTIFWWNALEYKKPIQWFKKVIPFIYAWIYPVDTEDYIKLKDSIDKLTLNDSSLVTENEVSPALGYWFRCWFLWLLHLDIVKERLWREFEVDVIMTSPQVTYRTLVNGDQMWDTSIQNRKELVKFGDRDCTYIYFSNPEEFPKPGHYIHLEEPIAKIEIITPQEFIGNLMALAQERRWVFKNQHYIDSDRVVLSYEIPMAELIWDFYDELKSLSSWYASLSYEFLRYQKDDLVKLDFLVAGEKLDALSMVTHTDKARYVWQKVCSKLKENIPKAQFAIAIQAAVGVKVVAREDISAYRKDVTWYLYGWDVTRKNKLLDKQKKWKKKMKQFWKVNIPSETFVEILKK